MARNILPTSGACAVFTIDPIASLNAETREDFEAVAACKALTSKKYAVVVDVLRIAPVGSSYALGALQQMLCIAPSMSLPIIPVTNEAHPSSREPLRLSTPLPWSDCYITGFSFARVRSPTLFTEEPIEYVFDADEIDRAHHFLMTDVQTKRWALAEKEYEDAHRAQFAMPPVSGDERDLGSVPRVESSPPVAAAVLPPPDLEHTSEHQGDDEETDNDDRSSSSSSSEVSAAVSVKRPPQGLVVVNFTHDLSTMEELSNPEDFFKEVEVIGRYTYFSAFSTPSEVRPSRIEEEAWPRIARAKAQTREDVLRAAANQDAQANVGLTSENKSLFTPWDHV
ncbi:hypothetical protein C8R47DRAFT_1243924 [Mycena vitilis]|nr:hypothetical protein C8R47DRAFT_1243924 [Mycena vitilis]